jgi:hypothetical protein
MILYLSYYRKSFFFQWGYIPLNDSDLLIVLYCFILNSTGLFSLRKLKRCPNLQDWTWHCLKLLSNQRGDTCITSLLLYWYTIRGMGWSLKRHSLMYRTSMLIVGRTDVSFVCRRSKATIVTFVTILTSRFCLGNCAHRYNSISRRSHTLRCNRIPR